MEKSYKIVVKPNGDIRLVSNLIALNDIVEKDNYRLANIREVVRATLRLLST